MLKHEKIMDDVARIAGGTASIVSGLSQSIRNEIKSRIEETIDRLDLVPRSDFERVETMLETARMEQEDLKKRLEILEGKTAAKKTANKKK